jgi:rhodanese-related sulfurtransferase
MRDRHPLGDSEQRSCREAEALVQEIGRHELQRLVGDDSGQLVEVLPAKEYENEHLPGALSIPLKRLGEVARKELDPSRPVVVYCWDSQ